MRALLLVALLCLVSTSLAAQPAANSGAPAPASAGATAPVKLVIESPSPGVKVESKMHMAKVAGTGLDGLRGGMQQLGGACGGCHKPYREDKK